MASEINNFVDDTYLSALYILDSTYVVKMIIDSFTDILWTERYCGYGEFEITIPYKKEIIETCQINDFVTIAESDVVMMIETIGITSHSADGTIITLSGRSLESLLEHRVILDKIIGTIIDGVPNPINFQDTINTIITNNLISPSEYARRISGFSIKTSTDTKIKSLSTESFQERGSNLYEKILKMCQEKNLGFRVNAVNNGAFQFELYFGVDRSRDQSSVPVVVFSDSYENLTSSEYLNTQLGSKNVIYIDWNYTWKYVFYPWVEGETSGSEIEYVTWNGSDVTEVYKKDAISGIARRELYMDAGDTYDLGIYRPPAQPDKSGVITQMTIKGKEEMAQYKSGQYFEGDVEPNRQFIYGRDYFLGDIVQLEGQYGLNTKCRITEIIRSHDSSGSKMTPTFELVE